MIVRLDRLTPACLVLVAGVCFGVVRSIRCSPGRRLVHIVETVKREEPMVTSRTEESVERALREFEANETTQTLLDMILKPAPSINSWLWHSAPDMAELLELRPPVLTQRAVLDCLRLMGTRASI